MQGGPRQGPQHKSLVCCVTQESSKEEINIEKEERITTENDTKVVVEEGLKEVDLGTDPPEPRPISISSKLLEEEKPELILLLKEFEDIFVWDYGKIPELDLGLVVHTLIVDPKAKPSA